MKITSRAKLKADSQEEWIHLWKEHFKNMLGKSPKVMNEPITKIISHQQNIKLGQLMQEELNVVLGRIKNRKAAGLDEILTEAWKTRKFDHIYMVPAC